LFLGFGAAGEGGAFSWIARVVPLVVVEALYRMKSERLPKRRAFDGAGICLPLKTDVH